MLLSRPLDANAVTCKLDGPLCFHPMQQTKLDKYIILFLKALLPKKIETARKSHVHTVLK